MLPSSGSSAISVRAVIGPMPGTEVSRSSAARQGRRAADLVVDLAVDGGEGRFQRPERAVKALEHLGVAGGKPAVRLHADHLHELAAARDHLGKSLPAAATEWSRPMFVGIDVSKDRLDVHLRPSGEAFAVSRDGAGIAVLVDRLRPLAPALVVLEATGGFEITAAAGIAGAAGRPFARPGRCCNRWL